MPALSHSLAPFLRGEGGVRGCFHEYDLNWKYDTRESDGRLIRPTACPAPHPKSALRANSDLSPQRAGRGQEFHARLPLFFSAALRNASASAPPPPADSDLRGAD